jgi:hypothetical protein
MVRQRTLNQALTNETGPKSLTLRSILVLICRMREALPTQARNWRASQGSSRPFPVRLDPVVSASFLTRGGALSLSRVCLRPAFDKHRITQIVAAFSLLLLCCAQAASAAPATDTWTGLDKGRVGEYQWEVNAKRKPGTGQEGVQQPCVQVGTTWELGPFNYRRSKYRACASAAGSLTASDPPLVATSVQPSSGESVQMTAIGMMFAPAARVVRISLSDGRQETIHLHRLSRSQATAARLSRFEYAAFAIRGLWCAERMVSQSASGKTLWDSGTDGFSCEGEGSGKTSFE